MKNFPANKKAIMKIQTKYIPGNQYVEIEIDRDARHLFDRTATLIRRYLRQSPMRAVAASEPTLLEAWTCGLESIEKLAYIPSRVLYLEPLEAGSALGLVAAVISLDIEPWPEAFPALMTLASLAPCQIACLPLPKIPAAWRANQKHDEIVAIYHFVQSSKLDNKPVLLFLSAFRLWSALSEDQHQEPEVRALVAELEAVSQVLRIPLSKLQTRFQANTQKD
ncbi:MAG: hypothetical protein ACOYM3_01660 [Terrimicrobiaceae bacterium]